MQDLLDNLNEAQKQAVTHTEGPLMIVAGAGTGKTTVITHRIAWLIREQHATSREILALTFTEKAAGEMEERVDRLLPMGHLDLSVHTFHAFCERTLRQYGMEIGLTRDFRVLTEVDAWLLMRKEFDRFDLEHYKPLGNPTRHVRNLLKHFAAAKEEQIWPDDYTAFVKEATGEDLDEQKRLNELARAYTTYEQILHDTNALDFGGLILYTLKLLQERPQVLKELQQRYRYLLVDELQDTNTAQYELVKLLAQPDNNITVVGDDDQSIYRFRGASLSNILQFDEDYPKTKHIVLTKNYRSHQEILDAAHAFIQANNPNRLEVKTGLSKQLEAHKATGGFVKHVHEPNLEKEVRAVLETIVSAKKTDKDLKWKDIAILVRANTHAEPFVEALHRQGIPYHFLAMKGLYTQPVVLDILAWMRLIDDPFDSTSAFRVFSHPMWKLSARELQAMTHEAKRQGTSLLLVDPGRFEPPAQEVHGQIQGLQNQLAEEARRKRASEMMVLLAKETGLMTHLQELPEGESRDLFRLLQQFYQRVKQFELRHDEKLLHHFLEEFAQERQAGEVGSLDFDIETGPDTVRIMTIHASKGLEFRQVFIVNLVDRRFPSQNRSTAIPLPESLGSGRINTQEHLEEERRLMYVAMTRAKEAVYLTSASDYGGARKKKPSLFLNELGYLSEKTEMKHETAEDNPFEEPSQEHPSVTNNLIVEVPKYLSFTQLQAYRTCPMQYKFAHIFKIPILGNYQMSFGKTMHGALQYFFEAWLETKRLPSKEKLLDLYEEHWMNDWYPNDEKRKEYRDLGKTALVQLYEQLEEDAPTPFVVEQPFTLTVGNVIMKGQIDRVDLLDDGLHIIDYKTGSPKTEKTLRSADKDQLIIYQMAAEAIWKKPVKRLSYLYLRDQTTVDFLGTEKDMQRITESIQSMITGLEEKNLEPTPGRHCGFCDFADICPFRLTSL